MAAHSDKRDSGSQLLEELEALSESLYQSQPTKTNRRTASFALPRTAVPTITSADENDASKVEAKPCTRGRPRRTSLSSWRSKRKLDDEDQQSEHGKVSFQPEIRKFGEEGAATSEKKGIWDWKPIRALSHIGKQKLSCLFSVEVVTVQSLPASMNGLRLSVCVRKKETKDGAVYTMPSRVSEEAADFEETLFVKCHVYCTQGHGKHLKFEPRPFWIYVFAADAEELDFGRTPVDLSQLIQESIEKSDKGTRVRQWDTSFNLSGKAKGGELVLKLGFQIMEKDGGIDIYRQAEELKSIKGRNFSSSFGRRQSKTSFSVPSPKMSSRGTAWTPARRLAAAADIQGIDESKLDETDQVPSKSTSLKKSKEPESKTEDVDVPEFEVVEKGVEVQDKAEAEEGESEEAVEGRSVSSEVVKEMVHDQVHMTILTELDSIAQQIKALESMMGEGKHIEADEETKSQRLDAEEENVTREFLQMLEHEESNGLKFNQPEVPPPQLEGSEDLTDAETKVYLPDLGKNLGCVVQTRDGGYLAAMNPLDTLVARKDTPKLAMQMSKPFVLPSNESTRGFELFQKMAAEGFEELSSQILSLMPLDELMGKTAEQIAFEGIASAIIQGRNKEGASSTAARTISVVKAMATATSTGRKDRISTGIWNVNENPLVVEEILAFSLQKIETMAVEALKIQAEMAEEDAPFDVSPLNGKTNPLASAVSLEDWIKNYSLTTSGAKPEDPATITLAVVVQLRDPLRRYEAVGGPAVVLTHATRADIKDKYDEEMRFKVTNLHIGGLKVRSGDKRNVWDSEKQKLTAMQWLLAYGLGKAAKKGKRVFIKGKDLLWSLSSRVMADMWLKPMRNPDIRFSK